MMRRSIKDVDGYRDLAASKSIKSILKERKIPRYQPFIVYEFIYIHIYIYKSIYMKEYASDQSRILVADLS